MVSTFLFFFLHWIRQGCIVVICWKKSLRPDVADKDLEEAGFQPAWFSEVVAKGSEPAL